MTASSKRALRCGRALPMFLCLTACPGDDAAVAGTEPTYNPDAGGPTGADGTTGGGGGGDSTGTGGGQDPACIDCTSSALIPEIAPPHDGDGFVLVTDAIPGSTVRVLDNTADEIGNGSSDVIGLSRSLVGGEVIYVVGQLAGCPAPDHAFSIAVTN